MSLYCESAEYTSRGVCFKRTDSAYKMHDQNYLVQLGDYYQSVICPCTSYIEIRNSKCIWVDA
jgi:hypothetical protein